MVRIKPDGTEEKIAVSPVTPRSDEAVTEAALRDPDAQPLTEADLARIEAAIPADQVAGSRYDESQMASLDSEHRSARGT